MRLTFLGKDTQGGNSPTLWETDDGQYVIQGFTLDAEALAHRPCHTTLPPRVGNRFPECPACGRYKLEQRDQRITRSCQAREYTGLPTPAASGIFGQDAASGPFSPSFTGRIRPSNLSMFVFDAMGIRTQKGQDLHESDSFRALELYD